MRSDAGGFVDLVFVGFCACLGGRERSVLESRCPASGNIAYLIHNCIRFYIYRLFERGNTSRARRSIGWLAVRRTKRQGTCNYG